jgi:acyl carrier protein
MEQRNIILEQINIIFKDTLNNDDIIVSEKTVSNDIEEWDSLSHIQLIYAIEQKFKIRFTSREIQTWKDVSEMINSIQDKIK